MIAQNARLLTLLDDLRAVKIYHCLDQHRDDAIMVQVAVPGEHYDIEFLDAAPSKPKPS